ncbi:phospholipid methyltransferase [bacterium]|nr:phospholipid methyltransferase [bacterium]
MSEQYGLHSIMVRIGNSFFRHRNRSFPAIIFILYVLAVPVDTVFGSEMLEHIKDGFAILLALLGLMIRGTVIGFAYIKRGGLNKKVYAENLVTEGMFALCRNPLYVGNMLLYAGVFLMHGNLAVMLAGIGFFAFIYQCIIYAEEAYLLEKFGDAYRAYCKDVPRWWITFSRFGMATSDMEFNLGRVIEKDYPTITTTIAIIAMTEFYEEIGEASLAQHFGMEATLLAITVGIALWAGCVHWLKKHKTS